jgi:tripartite ATP-independent transporter DctM subunit
MDYSTIFIMAASFMVFLFAGMPIAFCLSIPGLLYFFMTPGLDISFIPHIISSPLFNFVLIALPAFLLSGRMMNGTGITNRLFDASLAIVGRLRGGLAYTTVVSSALFASMSGTAVGDAGGIGQVQMQMMTKTGYKRDFAAGLTAASSILGPLIPPSVAMVILGASSGISIGKLFLGGLIPGVLMAGGLMVYIACRAHLGDGKNWPVNKVPAKDIPPALGRAFLPILTPIIIIGGISWGIVTPTEAAVVAIDYAILLGIYYKELSLKTFIEILEETVATSGTFMFIVACAGFFTLILTKEGLPQLIFSILAPIVQHDVTMAMLVICGVLFVVGCFIDTTAAILLVTPILMPIVNKMGIDPIYFGVVMVTALMTGIITPPFGICLFILSDVSKLPVSVVTKEAVKYLPTMIIVTILVAIFPPMSTWLPKLFFN